MDPIAVTLTNEFGLRIDLAWWVVLLVVGAIVIVFLRRRHLMGRISDFVVDEAEIGIGSQKIKFKANIDDLQIAFKFWTEIATRKIGIPIDEEHDVVVEVYNSWYEFFRVARELIKTIPVSKVRENESTRQIVRISVLILNKELRPHLTRWQARYRRWWDTAIASPESRDISPQDLQRQYPHYEELMKELKAINKKLVVYAQLLEQLIHA
jgi:hypothetical protein